MRTVRSVHSPATGAMPCGRRQGAGTGGVQAACATERTPGRLPAYEVGKVTECMDVVCLPVTDKRDGRLSLR